MKPCEIQCLTWLSIERSRSQRHWLPWRPVAPDEQLEDCEDPDRIVLFDDVRSFLFSVDTKQQQFLLLYSYLQFLGVPVQYLKNDHSILSANSTCLLERPDQIYSKKDLTTLDVDSLDHELLLNLPQFVHNTLQQCRSVFTDCYQTTITVLLIRYQLVRLNIKQCKQSVKDVKKTVKTLMREESNRNNLWVWDTYARLLWQLEQYAECKKVLETAITMLPDKLDRETSCAATRLYRTYAELELGITERINRTSHIVLKPDQELHKTRVLHMMCVHAEAGQFSPPDSTMIVPPNRVLKCRHKFQHRLDLLLNDFVSEDANMSADLLILPYMGSLLEHWTVVFALFQYVTKGVEAASVIFQEVVAKLQSLHGQDISSVSLPSGREQSLYLGSLQGMLLQDHCSLLYCHIRHNMCPRGVLRGTLLNALQSMPANDYLLQLLVELETPTSIAGQHRRCFKKLTAHSDSPVTWLFAVLAEYRRVETLIQHQNHLLQDLPSVPGG